MTAPSIWRMRTGNIESTLPPCRRLGAPNSEAQVFPEMPDVDRIEQADGSVSLRVRGLEFARAAAGKITCGISRRKRSTIETVVAMSREISRVLAAGWSKTGSILSIRRIRSAGWNRRCARIPGTSTHRFDPCPFTGRFRYSSVGNGA